MKRNLGFLIFFWLLASCSFIWVYFTEVQISKIDSLVIFESIGLIGIASFYLYFIICFFHHHSICILLLPLFMPLISLLRIINLTAIGYPRSYICVGLVMICIFLFHFIIYYEKISKLSTDVLSLIHHRYIEYLHSFIWLIIFGLVAYTSWQVNRKHESIQVGGSAIVWLSQLILVTFFGVLLVGYAFQTRFEAIEIIFNKKRKKEKSTKIRIGANPPLINPQK